MSMNLIITNRDKVLKTMQDIQLELLQEFDRICRKHDIKYSLGAGTCLGQVRHGGFIPWDDDIDVDITSDNYDRFLDVVMDELDHERFFLRCRATDEHHNRSAMRLERKGTHLDLTRFNGAGYDPNVGVFIDIFRLNYLPDNRTSRKLVGEILFFLRALQEYKNVHVITYGLNRKAHVPLLICNRLLSAKKAIQIEEYIVKKNNRKTGWINGDTLIAKEHAGYSSEGMDEYRDVMFDGIRVMDKKKVDTYLTTLYGPDYNKWLPQRYRLSHHTITGIDLGEHAKKYDLPEDYSRYFSVSIDRDKSKRMMTLSQEMVDEVARICREHGLEFYRAVRNGSIGQVAANSDMWIEPVKLAMKREDFDTFSEICRKDLSPKYFYQTKETDKAFEFTHARIRLNDTVIREKKIPAILEREYHKGLFIDIIPLESAPDDPARRARMKKTVGRLNRLIRTKWRKSLPKYFMDSDIKTKAKLVVTAPFSIEHLRRKLNRTVAKYDDHTSNHYIDGTGIELSGYELEGFQDKNGSVYDMKNKKIDLPVDAGELLDMINRRYGHCVLNFFDNDEYQLSAARYDNESDRLLTNREIFGYD